MKVLITNYLGLGSGGGEVNTFDIAKALQEKCLQVVIASTGSYGEIAVKRFMAGQPLIGFQKNYLRKFLEEIIREEKIDLVHAMDRRTTVAAILAAKNSGIPAVVHLNDHWFACPKSTCLNSSHNECLECSYLGIIGCCGLERIPWEMLKWRQLKEARKYLKQADCFISVGSPMKERMRRLGFGSRIEIIPNVLELGKFAKAKPKKELRREGKKTILFVGRFSYEKGISNLIRLAESVLQKRKDCFFVFIGEGQMRQELEALQKKFSKEMLLLKPLPYKEMPSVFASADVGIFPSIWQEPFGRTAVEQMAAGKPLIASATGSPKDFILQGKTGFLAEPKKIRDWEKILEKLLDNSRLRKKIGANAQNSVLKRFAKQKIIGEIISVYKSLGAKT